MKMIICGILGLFLMTNIAYSEERCPLKLTIKTDKEIYAVGDEIKVLFTVENFSNKTIDLHYTLCSYFDYEIIVLGNREYELFPAQGTRQLVANLPNQHTRIEPTQTWTGEELIARVVDGKVYKYDSMALLGASMDALYTNQEIDRDKYRELYYEGFHISNVSCSGYKGDILIKNGSGQYGVTFKICDKALQDVSGCVNACLESDMITIAIKDE